MNKPDIVAVNHLTMKQFVDAGLIPPNCRRIVIDFEVGCAARCYYETFADQRHIDVMNLLIEQKAVPLSSEPHE